MSLLLAALLLVYPAAAPASATGDYNDGIEFFRQADYHAAITRFRAAERKGMESAALYYNLGSAYFRTGQYADSKNCFTRVTEYPDLRALAEFNLGMIALRQDDTALALRHLEYAEAHSDNDSIVDASKQAIAGLAGTGSRWSAAAKAFTGHDDNISATPDSSPAGVDDGFYNVYASADFVVHDTRQHRWLFEAAFFRIDYGDSDSFDQDFYTLGLRNEHRYTGWDTVTRIRLGRSTYGGDDLQSFYKLDVLGTRSMPANHRLFLQLSFDDDTSENPLYAYLEGRRLRARIALSRNTTTNGHRFYYEGEINNRGELVTSSISYDYSPVRHTLGANYTHKFSRRWHLTGDVSYRASDFPASSTTDRDDDRLTLGILLHLRIDPTLIIRHEIQYRQNDSTVDTYTWDKTVISLGVSKRF